MSSERGDRDRDRDRQSSSKIYVSGLSVAFTEDDLRKQFEKYGSIQSLSLKQRDTFSFAFIEFKSSSEAQQAIEAMNKKVIDGKQIKVEISRSNGRRDFNSRGGDRGGYRGDRGGYRGDRDRGDSSRRYDDRGPRRDFGDRPKGCFNCSKQGHIARQCPEPRKPRQFNSYRGGDRSDNRGGDRSDFRGGDRSDYRGGDRDRNDRDRNDRGDDKGYKRRSRSRSGDKHKKHRRRSSSSSRS